MHMDLVHYTHIPVSCISDIQYWPTRPGMMTIVGRLSDGTLLDSFKTQSSATSPPSDNVNISLQTHTYQIKNIQRITEQVIIPR